MIQFTFPATDVAVRLVLRREETKLQSRRKTDFDLESFTEIPDQNDPCLAAAL